MQNGSHLWQLALQKRKEGRCPLEPGEVAVLLRGMGYPKETEIYVASGQVYGGHNRMAPLRNMFPNLVILINILFKLPTQLVLTKHGHIMVFHIWNCFAQPHQPPFGRGNGCQFLMIISLLKLKNFRAEKISTSIVCTLLGL